MMEKICFLFGHRDAPGEVFPKLEAVVERHYMEYGIRQFVVGNYGRFDRLAGRAVTAAKKRHSDIYLSLLLPYHPALRPVKTPPGFDGTLYPEGMETVPYRLAILYANRYMAEQAFSVICYVNSPGNARNLLHYAAKKAIPIENIADAGGDCFPLTFLSWQDIIKA